MALFLLASSPGVAAEETIAPPAAVPAWREVSAGADVTQHSWSAYTTLTLAPFGALDREGFRFRSVGGYGRYRYSGTRAVGTTRIPTEFRGVNSFTDLMVGYQLQHGTTTLKGFAGASGIAHSITPFDRDNEVTGLDIGLKAALEVWAEISAKIWASADVSWTAAHETYASRLRGGWRVVPELSAGIEAGLHGNATYDGHRGGVFLRYAQDWGEVSVSGGVTGDIDQPTNPYGTVNWLIRY